jgi:hypothetical protein
MRAMNADASFSRVDGLTAVITEYANYGLTPTNKNRLVISGGQTILSDAELDVYCFATYTVCFMGPESGVKA